MNLRKRLVCVALGVVVSAVAISALYCVVMPTILLCSAVEQAGGYIEYESHAPEWSPASVRTWRVLWTVTQVHCGSGRRTGSGRIVQSEQSKKYGGGRIIEKVLAVPSVKGLYLGYSELSDADFRLLGSSRTLNELGLHGTNIKNDDLRWLLQNARLRFLKLNDTAIDDGAVEHLVKMKQLRDLDLSGTKITDEGMHALMACPELEAIEIHNTNVSPKCVQECKEIRPDIAFRYPRKKSSSSETLGPVVN